MRSKMMKVSNIMLCCFFKNALRKIAFAAAVFILLPVHAYGEFKPSGDLEIHYINVGQGNATLIIGPNGQRIMYDFGWLSGKENVIVPYLTKTVGLKPEDGLHYSIVSHRDSDHYTGYLDVVKAGFDILVANYEAGSPKLKTPTIKRRWLIPAIERTSAGAVQPIPVGLTISLGNGAEAIVVAANGKIYGRQESIRISNENDRSVALFIHYGKFQFIIDGDLGSGPEACTRHITSQKNLQPQVAQALLDLGLINQATGVDVMHIAHHGSESSTSAAYCNMMRPQVGIISVGPNQGSFKHPRRFVVDSVLFGPNRPACVTAPSLELLLQTDDGIQEECDHCGVNTGLSVGDIFIRTDGTTCYNIKVSNCLFEKTKKEVALGIGWKCRFDEDVDPSKPCCEQVVLEADEMMVSRCAQ